MRTTLTRTTTPARARGTAAVVRASASLALVAAVLAGCSEGQDLPDVDLDKIGEDVQEGVDAARGSLDELESALDGATIDEEARAQVEEAVTSASGAIDQARSAVEGAADDAGPEAQQAVADARTALADARADVEAAAENADGALATALAELQEQIAALEAQLTDA